MGGQNDGPNDAENSSGLVGGWGRALGPLPPPALLVGWASGLHDEAMVVEYVETAAKLLLKGMQDP